MRVPWSASIFCISSETPSKLAKTGLGRITRLMWLGQLDMIHYKVYCSFYNCCHCCHIHFVPFLLLWKFLTLKKKRMQKCWNRNTRQLLRAKRPIQQDMSFCVLAFCESFLRHSEKPSAKSEVTCWFSCQRRWHSLWRQYQKTSDCFKWQICQTISNFWKLIWNQ